MESRIRVLLLTVAALATVTLTGGCSLWPFGHHARAEAVPTEASNADGTSPAVIDPTVKRRTVKPPKIKSSDFEAGIYAGTYSAEDFGINPVYGARLAYHISEDFFAEGILGTTKTGLSSYEELSGSSLLLTNSERQLTYYNLGFGYNLFPGEVFIGRNRAFNSAVYVIAGVGATKFGGGTHFTVMAGAGYRLLITDHLAAHLDVRDHVFQDDLLGYQKTVHNLESTLGVTTFF
jgi:outer membrane beta-barrel protein